jgi:rhamnopyranosyl-N-acetylglucosaminyl-diphospho-decaprenol beta-1,3/1,4-galactofuranosyltransferase
MASMERSMARQQEVVRMKIHAVIVTYNRRELVARCIEAVLNQTVKVANIYLVDNASTDGTHTYLREKGLAPESTDGIPAEVGEKTRLHYIRLEHNSGGAGGFHKGMQMACSQQVDLLWIMDDDGYPAENCLERQLEYVSTSGYVMPISLSTEKKDSLTWLVRKRNGQLTRSYSELKESFPTRIMKHAVPFNGLLIARRIIEEVGLPKKEMFIWGDDFEYQYRCIKSGVVPITALDAIFFHPEDKATCYRMLFGSVPIIYSESKLRFTCLIRNSSYNYWNYKGKHLIVVKFILYSWLFLVEKRFAAGEYIHYLKCVKDGIQGNFTRHLRYLREG